MFHNNIVEISEKNEQATLVENQPPSYLPNRFLHSLHSFLYPPHDSGRILWFHIGRPCVCPSVSQLYVCVTSV